MKLPEPARTLWTRHREAIERIATTPGAESQIMLGGETLLAARWKHRESTDIEGLRVAPRRGARAFDLHAHRPNASAIEWNAAT